ncbi:MAG: alpha/beta fold hydrolase [Actinomycetota bacterium]
MSLPIVLLPGSLCDDRLFAELDLDDHALVHADLTRSDSITGLARDVLADAPERFIAVGLSLGAIVAAEMAGLEPDRVAGLALLDTNLAPIDPAQAERRERWRSDVRAGLLTAVVEELVPQMTTDPAANGPLIVEMAMATGPDGFLNQNHALLHRTRDRRPELARFPGPVFVGYGYADAVCPPALHAELVVHRSDAELVGFDEAGHLVTLDQPEALSAALRRWITTVHIQPTMEGYST